MEQFFWQTQWMSIAQPTNYLDVIRQKKAEEEKKKSLVKKEEKFNLYDFSKVQKPTLNFWPWVSQAWVTNIEDYKKTLPEVRQIPKYSLNDEDYSMLQMAVDKWASQDEALNLLRDFKMQKNGIDILNEYSPEQIKQTTSSTLWKAFQLWKWMLESPFWQFTKWVVEKWLETTPIWQKASWLISWENKMLWASVAYAPEYASNIISFAPWSVWVISWNEKAKQVAEEIKTAWKDVKKSLQNALNVDDQSLITQLTENWIDIWSLFTPTWAETAITKLPWLSEKIVSFSDKLEKLAETSPKVYKTVKNILSLGKTAWVWAGEMAKYDIVSQWEIKPEDVAIWAVTWPVLNVLWKWIAKTKQLITKTTPENLIVSWLINPSDLKNASERIAKLTWKELDVTDTSKWLLDKLKKWWDKANIRSEIQKSIESSKKEASDLLISKTTPYNNEITNNLKQWLREKLSNFWKFNKNWDFVASAWNQEKAKEILNIINKKELTLNEINNWRTILAENIFTKQWSPKDIQSLEWLQNIWKNTSKFIEEQAPWFRKLNKDTEVWIALDKAIAKKEASDLSKQILAYTWFGWTLWGFSAYQTWDPTQILYWLMWWYVWGKTKELLTSTPVKTKLALFLNKFNKQEQQAIKDYISSDWATKLSDALLKKIKIVWPTISNLINND